VAVARLPLAGPAAAIGAGLALTLSSALFWATPARAEVVTVPDARGDLMTQDATSGVYRAVPDDTDFDIVATRFRHRLHRVRARIQFVSLPRGTYARYHLRIVTNEGYQGWVDVLTTPELKHVQTFVSYHALAVDCPVHYTFDYAHSVVVMGVARRCLRHPRWVRIGAYAVGGKDDATVEDDAARERIVAAQHGHATLISRRLTRGSW
jgi:hypothetical protein